MNYPDRIDHIDAANLVRIDKLTLLSYLFRMGSSTANFELSRETTYQGETIRARIVAPGTLGAAEQDLIYALASLASKQGEAHVIVRTTITHLLHEMDRKSDSSKESDRLRQSIQALSGVIVTLEREKHGKKYVAFSTKQMIRSEGDLEGNLQFELHPLLDAAIRGNNYIGIDIRERMSLGETARILHSGLCARINRGSFGKQRVGALMTMVFGSEEVTARRKTQFSKAREELIRKGWKIDVEKRGEAAQPDDVATIHRPARSSPGAPTKRSPPRPKPPATVLPDGIDECPF